jgi:hypothetical protein
MGAEERMRPPRWISKNLVKGGKTRFFPQLIEKAAKINLKKCPNHPLQNAILNI